MSSAPNPPNRPENNSAASTLEAEPFVMALPDDASSGQDWLLWAGVLFLLVFVVFFPAVSGTYLWDDEHHPGLIPNVSTLSGLGEIWTPLKATPQYYPLTFTTFWLEYHVWKENTIGYHLDNMILHALSCVLLWRLLRRLKFPGAWLAAAIWAIHPMQAESVDWISERKNVLAGLLFFSSIWFFVEFAGLAPPADKSRPGLSADRSTYLLGNRWLSYVCSLILFALALLAKTVACAMPADMIVLLWWKRKKLNGKNLLPLVPFFLVGMAMAFETVKLETASNGFVQASGPDWAFSPIQRLLIAARGFWFYIAKLAWPNPLIFIYPRPLPDATHWIYVLAAIALLALLWIKRDAWGRGPLSAVCFYALTIFPALGFINIYPMRYSFVANHFQYLAGLGIILLAVGLVARALRRASIGPVPSLVISLIVLTALSGQTWLFSHVFESNIALWRDNLAKNPDAWMAYDNLGNELVKLGAQLKADSSNENLQGLTDEAAADSQESTANFNEAEGLFHHAIAMRDTNCLAHNSLGTVYRELDRWQDAESEFRIAATMDQQEPDLGHQYVAPYLNYASILEHNHPGMDVLPWLQAARNLTEPKQGRISNAEVAGVQLAFGNYYFQKAAVDSRGGRHDLEAEDLQRAIDNLNAGLVKLSNDVGSLYNLGRAWQLLGQIEQDKSTQAEAAGDLDQAAAHQQQSYSDDSKATDAYKRVLDAVVPQGRHAGAIEGLGTIFAHDASEFDAQSDAVKELLQATEFFKGALEVDSKTPGAQQDLAGVYQVFLNEAEKARNHEATWEPLRKDLLLLQAGSFSKSDLKAADKAVHDAAWPLPIAHPLRPTLATLHEKITAYLSATAGTVSAATVSDAATAVLTGLKTRDPAIDHEYNVAEAALCYDSALEARPNSAEAWNDVKQAADELAALKDQAMFKDDLTNARSMLQKDSAATQPTTKP